MLVSMQACAQIALQEAKEELRLVASLDDEARLYHKQGKYAEAEPVYQIVTFSTDFERFGGRTLGQ